MEHCREHDWGVVFGTLTVRHKRADSLNDVIKMAQEVWRKSRSHRRIKDLFSRTHEVGYVRAMEVTYSHANGWHVHFHCYYVFDHVLGKSEAADFSGAYAAEWVETARRCGYAAPLARNQRFRGRGFVQGQQHPGRREILHFEQDGHHSADLETGS